MTTFAELRSALAAPVAALGSCDRPMIFRVTAMNEQLLGNRRFKCIHALHSFVFNALRTRQLSFSEGDLIRQKGVHALCESIVRVHTP